jgi:phosphatidylserine/phosphatidylglycerophosphate/cardiolipin synthase-like enzyme
MMVDDVFVAIGSANINRRGLFHDGEIAAFTIPERLKSSPDNPARQLRTTLWAEHLGLFPGMGPALFHDPMNAFELFRRSSYVGNRFRPFPSLPAQSYLSVPLISNLFLEPLAVIPVTWLDLHEQVIWEALSDPTSNSDPHPTPGPDLLPAPGLIQPYPEP